MSKEKFKFNDRTFQLEKVEVSLKQKFKQLGIHTGFSLLLVLVFLALAYPIMYRMINRQQLAEIEKLNEEYEDMIAHVETIGKDVSVLELRNDSVYSGLFGTEPLAEALKIGGTGGSDQVEHLKGYANSDLMINAAQNINRLEAKLKVHKSHFAKIERLAHVRSEKLDKIPAIQPIHNHNMIRTSSGFGMRVHPVYHVEKMHTGIDFTANVGTKIHATGDGKVVKVENDRHGYGKHVVIEHGFGYKTLYAHMNKFAVRVGDQVKRGGLIGYVGNTGTSTGPHLHYEVMKNGKKIDPANFFFNDLSYDQYLEMQRISAAAKTSLD